MRPTEEPAETEKECPGSWENPVTVTEAQDESLPGGLCQPGPVLLRNAVARGRGIGLANFVVGDLDKTCLKGMMGTKPNWND